MPRSAGSAAPTLAPAWNPRVYHLALNDVKLEAMHAREGFLKRADPDHKAIKAALTEWINSFIDLSENRRYRIEWSWPVPRFESSDPPW
jgi:hypothetical protein